MAPPIPAFKSKDTRQNQKEVEQRRELAKWKLRLEEKARYERMLNNKIQEAQKAKDFQASKMSLLDSAAFEYPTIYLKPVNEVTTNEREVIPLDDGNKTSEDSDSENESIGEYSGISCTSDLINSEDSLDGAITKLIQKIDNYEDQIIQLQQQLTEKEKQYEKMMENQQAGQEQVLTSRMEQLQQDLQKSEELIQAITKEAQIKENQLLEIKQTNKEEKQQLQQVQKKLQEQEQFNRQLLEKIAKQEETINTKQNEIQNKTTKIINLKKEIKNQQQAKLVKKVMYNKETMTKVSNKSKRIQTNYKLEEVAVQTDTVQEEVFQNANLQIIEEAQLEEKDKHCDEKNIGYHDLTNFKEQIRRQLIKETSKIEEKLQKLQNILEETKDKIEKNSREENSTLAYVWEKEELAEAAIVIRCKDYKIVKKVKDLLNEELIEKQTIPTFYSKLTRNRKTIVIKTQTEDQLKALLLIIEGNENIKKTTEIIYKQHNTQKLIITSIPKTIQPEYLLKLLNNQQRSSTIKMIKIVQKKESPNYQVVIVTDNKTSRNLLNIGHISIGFRCCRITIYRPIVRCAYCQLYGHSASNCRRKPICAFCAMGHLTSDCHNSKHRHLKNCTNCLNNENYTPHTADSPQCPIFQNLIKARNNSVSDFVEMDTSIGHSTPVLLQPENSRQSV